MQYEYIDDNRKLADYIDRLADEGIEAIALDIEGESNLHQYGEKLCLIQIFDGRDAVIIDPFTTSMKRTRTLIENRSIMKIMYDAPSDRAFLYKNYGVDILSVLDLQAAVLLLGRDKNDLGSVLKEVLGIETAGSKKKFQRYNWTRRPIREEALEYALNDVIHLFRLKDTLLSRVVGDGLLDKFLLKNIQSQNKPHVYDKRPGVLRSSRFKKLNRGEQERLSKLVMIREAHAREMNVPPHTVLANEILFDMALKGKTITEADFGKRVSAKTRAVILEKMNGLVNS